jgi:peptidoglycan/xylan/chitin deacetylase (PgdA/CDA1 family)
MSTAKAWLKAGIRRAARWLPRKPQPAILMYHRIARETFDPWGLAVGPHRFAAQVAWLKDNRAVLPLSEFARLHKERTLPDDAVSLTFDDGYASVLIAVPLLEEHGLHATVFLPTMLIERGHEFWWDELARLILEWRLDTLRLGDARMSVPPAHNQDRFWLTGARPSTPRQKLFQSVWSRLHAMPPEALDAGMAELRSQAPIEPGEADRPLAADQVRLIGSSMIAFGSHGLSHPSLPSLAREQKLREIQDSRTQCAAMTGTAPMAFAYPYGDFDETSSQLIEQAGYACACVGGDKFVTSRSDVFALPRLRVGNWEPRTLRDMLGG